MPKKSTYPQRIISFLQQYPEATRIDIQNHLGCSYAAVQKNLKNLEAQDLLKPGFIINQKKIDENNFTYWIMIHTKYLPNEEKEYEKGGAKQDKHDKDYQTRLKNAIEDELLEERWSKAISLRGIFIVFSAKWDIILSINSKDAKNVTNFVTQYLRTHHAVDDTSTSWSPPDT